MDELKKYKILNIYIKIDNFNYYYYIDYEKEEEKKSVEFVQPFMLNLTDIKRCVRRYERKESK